jgi:hypothetical protein
MSATEHDHARSLSNVRAVVARLRAHRRDIAEAICAHVQEEVPDTAASRDARFQAGILPAVTALLEYSLQATEHGATPVAPIPPEADAQARRASHVGVKLGAVLRRYLAGHRRLNQLVAEEAAQLGFASDDAALHHIRVTQEAVLEHLMASIERIYDEESEQIGRSPEQRRLGLVRSLIDDVQPSRADLDRLGYRLDAWHVGLIVTGSSARRALEDLNTDRQLLRVSPDGETVWAWLGGQRQPTHAEIERLCLSHAAVGVSLAIGEPATGIEGWRQTYMQAQDAMRVALYGSHSRIRYADIALLAPWLSHPDRARSLIDLCLSPLVDQRDDGTIARTTLWAYFQAARNVSAAARQLGVDRRTVAYRLRTIEDRLGYPLSSRFAELEVALRLHCLLNDPECTDVKKAIAQISTLA